jgi:hypothetical protein
VEMLIVHFFPASCHFIPPRSKLSSKHPTVRHPICVFYPEYERQSYIAWLQASNNGLHLLFIWSISVIKHLRVSWPKERWFLVFILRNTPTAQ